MLRPTPLPGRLAGFLIAPARKRRCGGYFSQSISGNSIRRLKVVPGGLSAERPPAWTPSVRAGGQSAVGSSGAISNRQPNFRTRFQIAVSCAAGLRRTLGASADSPNPRPNAHGGAGCKGARKWLHTVTPKEGKGCAPFKSPRNNFGQTGNSPPGNSVVSPNCVDPMQARYFTTETTENAEKAYKSLRTLRALRWKRGSNP